MTLSDTLARAVAAGLTERRRAALLWLPADGSPRVEDKTVHRSSLWSIAASKVCDGVTASLAQLAPLMRVNGKSLPEEWSLTSFGRRVRAIVEQSAIKDRLNTEPVTNEAGNG